MGEDKRDAIIATLDLLAELTDQASVTVPVEDFATWLAVLNSADFYLMRRGDDERLYAFESGGHHRGKRVFVDTHPVGIVGHEVPAIKEGESFSSLALPIAEAANLRGGGR